MCENPKISRTRCLERVGKKSGSISENFEISEGIGFPENFENPAIVSRTALQCCIAAYKICKYTVEFLLSVLVKLLETWIRRIV